MLFFGIGSQQSTDDIKNKKIILKKNIVEFMFKTSKKARNLFIRCENTKQLFNYYGIENVVICGCPSILLNINSELGNVINDKFLSLKKK